MRETFYTLIFLLCLSINCQAMSPAMLGGCGGSSAPAATAYCTGATTCTATTPGSCDLLCEDFEGTSHCVDSASYDSVCRSEHIWAVTVGGTGSIDFTTTHSGTFACTDKESNAAKVTVSTGNTTMFYVSSISSANDTFTEFYVNVNSLTLDDGKRQGIHGGFYAGSNLMWRVTILRTGSVYNLEIGCGGCAAASVGSTDISSYLDGSTWMRIGIAAKKSDDTFTLYLNGNQEVQRTDYTSTATLVLVAYGSGASSYREGNSVMQYDNIAISASSLPGGCND